MLRAGLGLAGLTCSFVRGDGEGVTYFFDPLVGAGLPPDAAAFFAAFAAIVLFLGAALVNAAWDLTALLTELSRKWLGSLTLMMNIEHAAIKHVS